MNKNLLLFVFTVVPVLHFNKAIVLEEDVRTQHKQEEELTWRELTDEEIRQLK